MNESYILTLLSRVHRQANKFIEKELKDRQIGGLAPSHGDILFQLYRHPSITMHQLSKLIDRDKSTVTVLVEKLVKLGYIYKEQDPQDSRIYRLAATEKGQELRPVFEEISERMLGAIYKDFLPEEKTVLLNLLQKIKI